MLRLEYPLPSTYLLGQKVAWTDILLHADFDGFGGLSTFPHLGWRFSRV